MLLIGSEPKASSRSLPEDARGIRRPHDRARASRDFPTGPRQLPGTHIVDEDESITRLALQILDRAKQVDLSAAIEVLREDTRAWWEDIL